MTSTTSPATALPEADLPGIRTLIGQLRTKGHRRGVLAIAAAPTWSGPDTVDMDGANVRIRTASSVLAIRDAITERSQHDWVVVLTDRTPAELPVGVLDHLTAGRLSNLDPWPALRELFKASRQEFNLLSLENNAARSALRELDETVPPAPGGVLTADHLFGALAVRNFGLQPGQFTPHHVALWSTDAARTAQFSAWQARTDPSLLDQFYAWLERRLGPLGRVITLVWRASGPQQLVPLGLVAALVDDSATAAAVFPAPVDVTVRIRTLLEVELGHQRLTEAQLAVWGNTATLAVAGSDVPDTTVRRAEDLVTRLQATALVGRSDVLPSALPPRIARFAAALDAAEKVADAGTLTAVENAWADVTAHRLARVDTRDAPRDVRVGAAALRLLRSTRRADTPPTALGDWLRVYRSELSWVDGAVDEAFIGAGDAVLAAAAHRIVTTVRAQRAEQDRAFAAALASSGTHRATGPGTPTYIEDLLDVVVKPLTVRPHGAIGDARPSPALLIVADGMSASAANEVVADAVRRNRPQWQEYVPQDREPVTVALAALPTVTEFSRCSLLSGVLARGGQAQERDGFSAWLAGHGLRGQGQVLFHKADLESVSRGSALAVDVRVAVDDTDHRPVIACVLNDIDDALDRSDPIGTMWTIDRFKRLDALMSAAAAVGRTVVLVSDHGHVVERREQPSVQRGEQVSARYRLAAGVDPATLPADEVLVDGPRVLTDDHRAVLAVDEQLRYTGLKAGYHGGGALAEAAIPVSILVNGAAPAHLGLTEAPSPRPVWWEPARAVPIAASPPPTPAQPPRKPAVKAPAQEESLFDLGSPVASGTAVGGPIGGRDKVAEVLETDLFARQYKAYGRKMDRDTIAALLRETIDSGGVLPLHRAAQILGVKTFRAAPAVQVLAQVFNTDGVVVLSVTGTDVELESAVLFEQFGVAP
ncbi:BREX-2 system phosphatase PglZ [Speluncibacter jeojiensis]|uniref:BREX-2 system phosphatase PglZ n=1 Tax=Speluncibacter jeojiensis TaxID=2710754 RepID=A0A9X4MA75_9ACTN|nr:BREX-2 system phosphatase PglZ [Corynebacteriales bacterium D3-21]